MTLGHAVLLVATTAVPAREVRVVMGGVAEVLVQGLADPVPALDAAFAALDRVDAALSLWKDSPLTRLNRAGGGRADPDIVSVLRHALEVTEASGGAFDPTVESLTRASRARVGESRVTLDSKHGRVWLAPGARLDLGGIAKGYAADLALAAVRAAGARAGLVDLGGSSLAVFGEPLWVEVRNPLDATRPAWAAFELQDAALASSGGDQRPGHILDPRTGRPAERVLAASVVAASGIEADALSTALFVLGAEQGLALLARRGAAGLVLFREAGRNRLRCTPGFARAHSLRVAPGVDVQP